MRREVGELCYNFFEQSKDPDAAWLINLAIVLPGRHTHTSAWQPKDVRFGVAHTGEVWADFLW